MKDIKRRIKSVESTMQITKAMELVASSKLRKAREKADKSKDYFRILAQTMQDLASKNNDLSSAYVKDRTVKKSLFIVIAGDRGLAGGYNTNVLKSAKAMMKGKQAVILPIGKKTADCFSKDKNVECIPITPRPVQDFGLGACMELSQIVSKQFTEHKFDEVYLVYTAFVSMINQEARAVKILPLSKPEKTGESVAHTLVEYEPSAQEVFDTIVPQYIAGMLYCAVADSFASEQGARRIAMESASDNAGEMIDSLSLIYNRARQSAITQEISEIVAGAGALN